MIAGAGRRWAAEFGSRLFAGSLGAAWKGQAAKAKAGAVVFNELRCPVCKAGAASYSGRSGEMKCTRGHYSAGGKRTAGPAPSAPRLAYAAPVKAAPKAAAPPAPVKREPLEGNVGHVVVTGPVTAARAGAFLRDTDALRDAGARAVVVHVATDGGELPAAESMCLRLQLLAALGVTTVAHVTRAKSAGSMIALSCAYSVTATDGEWFVHDPHLPHEPRTPEDLAHLADARDRVHALLLRRTVMGRDELAGVAASETGSFDSSAAFAQGLSDEIGSGARALEVAVDAAAGRGLPPSGRRLALESRPRA